MDHNQNDNKKISFQKFLKFVELGPEKIKGRIYYGYHDDVISIANIFIVFAVIAFFPVVMRHKSYLYAIPVGVLVYFFTRIYIYFKCEMITFKRKHWIFSIWLLCAYMCYLYIYKFQ